ncbi:MAG: alpha/beta hydrolase fold domain-containing protein [Pseudolysinimonas sp.]
MDVESLSEPAIQPRLVETRAGAVPVRLYLPAGEAVAGLVWAHGGGFLGGDLDMPEADWVSRSLAARGIVVASVDYSLAPVPIGYTFRPIEPRPGVHYPVASEQLTDVFCWATGEELGVPAGRWAIGGASAGGNLAAGAALRLRDESGPQAAGVLLVYAVLHYRLPPATDELRAKLGEEHQASPGGGTYLNDNYLGPASPQAPYAYAAGKDLRGLPPVFVLNADVDELRASSQAFAAEVAAAGIDVVQVREGGTAHGYLNEPDDPGALRSIARIAAWLTGGDLWS